MCEPLRILIVEDEAAILMQLEMEVVDQGHEVVATAMTSREAIDLAAATTPDLMLVDLNLLDGPTGLDVARHVRQTGKTEVIFLTANASRVSENFDDAIGILAKPCSRAALRATLRFVSECLRTPPPTSRRPMEFTMLPAFARRLEMSEPS